MDERAFQAQERAFQEHVTGQVHESGDETPRKRPGDKVDCTPRRKRLFLNSGIPSTPKTPETPTRKCLTIQQKQELIKAYDNLRKLDKKMSKMQAARELCIHYTSLNSLLRQSEKIMNCPNI